MTGHLAGTGSRRWTCRAPWRHLLVLLHHVLQVPAPSSFAFPGTGPEPSALRPFGSAGVDLFVVAADQIGLAARMAGDLAFSVALVALSITAALLLHHVVEQSIMCRARAMRTGSPATPQSGFRQATI